MPLLYRSYSDLHNDLTHWAKHLPPVSAVCGVPRSGVIVASQLAQILRCPLIPIEQILEGRSVKDLQVYRPKCCRPLANRNLNVAPILILDDTCSAGRTRRELLPLLETNAKVPYLYGALYARPQAMVHWPDLLHGYGLSEYNHTFQWNLLMDRVAKTLAIDMDGILCYDWQGTLQEEIEGSKYEEWILNAPPLRLPTEPVRCIITNRLERWRKQTETWLQKHGVRYTHLEMYPGTEHQRARDWVSHKTQSFVKHRMAVSGFIESDYRQAAEIAKRTGFSVIHMESGTSWNCKTIKPPMIPYELQRRTP